MTRRCGTLAHTVSSRLLRASERTLANRWLLALAYVGPEHAQPVSPH